MIKKTIKRCIDHCKLSRITTAISQSFVILRYHSVKEDPDSCSEFIGGIAMDRESFRQQMKIISGEYNVVDLNDIHAFFTGKKKIPRQAVAVTFDDGFKDNLLVAAPIMEEFGVRGTIYVSTKPVITQKPLWFLRLRGAFSKTTNHVWKDETSNTTYDLTNKAQHREAFLRAVTICVNGHVSCHDTFLDRLQKELEVQPLMCSEAFNLTPAEIVELDRRGHVIGSHSVDHYNIAHIETNAIRYQISESKKYLEGLLKKEIIHFSYPKPYLEPDHNETTRKELEKMGHKTAVTCDNGSSSIRSDALALKRIFAQSDINGFRFQLEKAFILG